MRAVLAFPLGASPTYVPLGIASLAAHLRQAVPGCRLRVLDLNIEAWTQLVAEDPLGSGLLGIVHGPGFFDQVAYRGEQPVWHRLQARVEALGGEARAFLEGEQPTAALVRLLEVQVERVLADDPELVGLSLVFPEQMLPGLALARWLVRRRPGLRIVLGGASLSAVVAEELLRACPEVSAILLGEGELGAARLCAGEPLASIPGLLHRGGGSPPAPAIDLDLLAPPDFSDLPLQDYFNPAPVLPALYSRGCRWRRCRFCVHNESFAQYRHKRADRFAAELASLASAHGARHFYLADQYIDAASLAALSEALCARGLDLCFHAMGRPTGDYTAACLEAYFRGGCRWISWGVESGSQRLLDLCGKGTRIEEVAQVIRDAAGAGISNLLMMIFGLPTSSDQDLEATLRFLEDAYPFVDAITASSFVLFTQSSFGASAGELGLQGLAARELLRMRDGSVVHGTRLDYRETGSDGTPRPARGPLELAAWDRRRRWLGELPFVSGLCAEHYLLHASRHP